MTWDEKQLCGFSKLDETNARSLISDAGGAAWLALMFASIWQVAQSS